MALKVNWDELPLGKVTDVELADRLGCCPGAVRYQRKQRGIPAFGGDKGPYKPRPPKGIDWDAVPLGQMTDVYVAKRLGVARSAVIYQRRRRGIPAFSKPRTHDEGGALVKPRPSTPTAPKEAGTHEGGRASGRPVVQKKS